MDLNSTGPLIGRYFSIDSPQFELELFEGQAPGWVATCAEANAVTPGFSTVQKLDTANHPALFKGQL